MDHSDHVMLLRDGVTPSSTWADLGSGTGSFTLALADLLGPQGVIDSIDKDAGALAALPSHLLGRIYSALCVVSEEQPPI
jgi:predicted RNA methylase